MPNFNILTATHEFQLLPGPFIHSEIDGLKEISNEQATQRSNSRKSKYANAVILIIKLLPALPMVPKLKTTLLTPIRFSHLRHAN